MVKKCRKRITSKFKHLFLGVTALFLMQCENESISSLEKQGNRTVTRISLNKFQQSVTSNKELDYLKQYFDINKPLENQMNRLEASDNPTILTNEIAVIDRGDYKTYTFKVITETLTELLYNLVLCVDTSGQVYDSYIIEYTPSQEYLTGASEYYSGTVDISKNNLFETDNLISTQARQCVVGVHTAWECSFGNSHAPGECNGTSFELVFTLEWGECSGEENNYVNPPSGGGDNSGGGNLGGGSGSNTGGSDSNNNDVTTTLVDPRCTGGKIMANNVCVCPEGKEENEEGNCVCIGGAIEYSTGICVVQTPPCDAIKRKINNANFKQKLDELKTKTGDNTESGYSQTRQGPFTALEIGNNGHSAHIPENEDTIGYMHTHVNKVEVPDIDGDGVDDFIRPIKMFSPGDIITFLKYVKNVELAGLPISKAYGVMISSGGNYTLSYRGNLSDVRTSFTRAEKMLLNRKYRRKFREFSNRERALLHFLKDDLGIGGVSLYEIKNDNTVQEKKLKDNGRVETVECEP